MAINIKNREAERLLEQLTKKTHLGKSRLVLELLRREAARHQRLDNAPMRKKRLHALARRAARRIGKRAPRPEKVIGYGADGLPR